VSQEAQAIGGRADVIWLVDTSPTMSEEIAKVQEGLADFVATVEATGADLHTVMIAGPSACMPAPVGSGMCPDDSNPSADYLHHTAMIGAYPDASIDGGYFTNALDMFRETFPQWRHHLRPDAYKMIIGISDADVANSHMTDMRLPEEVARDMYDWIEGQSEFGGATWVFSAIACRLEAGVSTACATIQRVYPELVDISNGHIGDLSDDSAAFQSVIDELAERTATDVTPVDCEWSIPNPPEGLVFDSDKVNVTYAIDAASPKTIVKVSSAGECSIAGDGWYYDNDTMPTRVIVCPNTCTTLQADATTRVDVAFGCKTEVFMVD
jgi:hypothetical protein